MFSKWMLFGLLGGLIGAAAWAAVAYFFHVQIGWIAWGIGLLVGLGVRAGAAEQEGPLLGVGAALIAVLSVLGGKYAAVELLVADFEAQADNVIFDAKAMHIVTARMICEERQVAGAPLHWPQGRTLENAENLSDFPRDVAQEAADRWNNLPAPEKVDVQKRLVAFARDNFGGEVRDQAFLTSFSPFDILWFLLATITAYGLGANSVASA